ncbi:SDH family Clp fold serine proteinase [Pseudothermotoga sp. U03pept]|uniref:SDH family Clp fold serine proteinase n=1 Tax=Pseudothermotoga sp. U03pept TaxID=3447012 RepID=UPI003F00324A
MWSSFIFEIFWMILILSFFIPFIRANMQRSMREALIRQIETKRKSRVITLIHRQESMSFFGLTFGRYINIEDSEEILRAIKLTPNEMPIDIVLHTPGGLVLAAEQIARALVKHRGKVTVFVPHYAMSGGTLIALAADEIVMDPNAVLGPLDPQIGGYPAPSILSVLEKKDINEIDDETLILADVAKKATQQMKDFVTCLLKEKVNEEKAKELAETFCGGQWTHDYPITMDLLKQMNLPVSDQMPQEIYGLMELYKQTEQRRPSVQYIPAPYKSGEQNNASSKG